MAVGVDGWVPGGQSTTRKEFSGKKITFPCLMFSLQVDDVPPKAEAVTVDAKLNVSTQTKRRNSPDVVEATREGRYARLLSIKTLSQKVDR